MKILGIDPGTLRTGFAVLDKNGKQLQLLHCGAIQPKKDLTFPQKLEFIYRSTIEILQQYQPTLVAMEDIFFAKNARSTLKLGCARGVVMLAAAQVGLPVYEYPPATVKQTVAGFGQATKAQMQKMVPYHLQLAKTLPEDANDAVAVALCHLQMMGMKNAGPAARGAVVSLPGGYHQVTETTPLPSPAFFNTLKGK